MPKIVLHPISNLQNETSAVSTINTNFDRIEAKFEQMLSRDGQSPNHMNSVLDMNNRRIINLGEPVDYTDAARHGDLQQYVDRAEDAAENAEEWAAQAQYYFTQTLTIYNSFRSLYLGAYSSAPSGTYGNGVLYFNSTTNNWYAYKVGTGWVILPSSTFLSLTDVSAPTSNRYLFWDGTKVTFTTVTVSPNDITIGGQSLTTVINNINNDITSIEGDLLDLAGDISALESGKEDKANKGIANGYAGLDASAQIANNQLRPSLRTLVAVTSNCDSSVTSGDYWCNGSTTNAPTTAAGSLSVIAASASAVTQVYTQASAPNDQWTRSYNGTSWTTWSKAGGDSGGVDPSFDFVDETSNRSVGTWYQNNTGHPLNVYITLQITSTEGTEGTFSISLSKTGSGSGTTVAMSNYVVAPVSSVSATFQTVVPEGFYVRAGPGIYSVSSWYELK